MPNPVFYGILVVITYGDLAILAWGNKLEPWPGGTRLYPPFVIYDRSWDKLSGVDDCDDGDEDEDELLSLYGDVQSYILEGMYDGSGISDAPRLA